jgi:hypothetical protein
LNKKIGYQGVLMIKKMIFGLLAAVLLVSGLAVGTAFAAEAPASSATSSVGPYEGVFSGVLHGDNGSRAPIALQMTHRDGVVYGRLYLGEGFYVDAGRCGGTTLPAMTQSASGRTLASDPSKLPISTSFNLGGFNIGVNLNSSVSADGDTINVSTSIDLPWLCGRDPSYSGTLHRIQ